MTANESTGTGPGPRSRDRHDEVRDAFGLIDAWLESQQVYERIPALSAGVVVGDRLAWSKGYGTVDDAGVVPATAETIYSICSISKLFTAVAAMQQCELGRVRLDEPITTYIPWAKIHQTADSSGPITLRALLSHSAGLPREAVDAPYWTGPAFAFPTRDQIHSGVQRQSTLFPTPRYIQYSNLGLGLVGEIVAAVTGQPYADYLREHILDPLGMDDTRPGLPIDLYGTRLPYGYGAIGRNGKRDRIPPFDTKGLVSAAGLTSTVEDLAKFAAWQFRLLRGNSCELLEPSTLREMQRVQFIDPTWSEIRGLGFRIDRFGKHSYVGHGGVCPGYRSVVRLLPENEIAVIVMHNAANDPIPFAENLFAVLNLAKSWRPKAHATPGDVTLDDYAGRYSRQPWHAEDLIVPWAGGLARLALPARRPASIVEFFRPKKKDVFCRIRSDGSDAEELLFRRDDAGKVSSFVQHSNIASRIA